MIYEIKHKCVKKRTFSLLKPEQGVQLVPIHPAGNINVIHEALNVQRQVRGVGAHQLLQFLALLMQPQHSPGVLTHVELVLALELIAEVIGQDLIKVAPAEVRVKCSGKDLMEQR